MKFKEPGELGKSSLPDLGKDNAWKAIVDSEGEEREVLIANLVSKMTLGEKIRQMAGDTPLLKQSLMLIRYNLFPFDAGRKSRWGIPPIRFTDGPRGVALGRSTCFPVSMARGATWDVGLEERVGEAMGIEARAQGANFFGGVCVNLPRHPGWGRAQETFGEDPYLLGEMGAAMVRGLQKHLMACAKHFACNSIEESRFYVDVRIDERALREIYLPHFKRCVDEGVAAIMSAYNRLNGHYCAHNSHLLREILKGEWSFTGLVMSDFIWGTRDTVKAALGGLDIEMPFRRYFGRKLKRAARKGLVAPEMIDEAVTRIIRQKARFAKVGDPSAYSRDKVASPEHVRLALEVARKSVVLLKNQNGLLPLNREGEGTIAVIGKLAKRGNIGDYGSSRVRPPYVITPLEAIRSRAASPNMVIFEDGEDIKKARRAAREARTVVVVAGLTGKEEGEYIPYMKMGGDREDLSLPRKQVELIKAVAQETDRCVVVLEGGSAIAIEEWKDWAGAILMAWYPGMEGGTAIAEILFGEVNPSGKLPITIPASSQQLPPFDKKAKSVEYGHYHGYRLCDRRGFKPSFPFGFGLSYSEYSYDDLRLSSSEIGKNESLGIEVNITNRGPLAGEEVAQLYVGYRDSQVERPVKELKGFARVHLEPGESKKVKFNLRADQLAYYHPDRGEWEIEEAEYLVMVGPSSRDEDLGLKANFRITSP